MFDAQRVGAGGLAIDAAGGDTDTPFGDDAPMPGVYLGGGGGEDGVNGLLLCTPRIGDAGLLKLAEPTSDPPEGRLRIQSASFQILTTPLTSMVVRMGPGDCASRTVDEAVGESTETDELTRGAREPSIATTCNRGNRRI